MAIEYPATLPAPLADSAKISRQDTRKCIAFDAGNSRRVNRASSAPHIVECVFSFDTVQMDAFEYWFKFTANFGASWINEPAGNAWLSALGFSGHYCRFLQTYQPRKVGGRFAVAAVLEIQQQALAINPAMVNYPTSNIAASAWPPAQGQLAAWYKADEDTNASYAPGVAIANFAAAPTKTFAAGCPGVVYGQNLNLIKTAANGFSALRLRSYNYYVYINAYAGYEYLQSNTPLDLNADRTIVFVATLGPERRAMYSSNYHLYTGEYGIERLNANSVMCYPSDYGALLQPGNLNAAFRDVYTVVMPAIGGTGRWYVNGMQIYSAPITANYSGSTTTYDFFQTCVLPQTWYMHEFLYYSKALTDAECGLVNNALKLKWQIE